MPCSSSMYPLVSHLTQATEWCFQYTVVTCAVGSFWSSLNILSWIWFAWQSRCSGRYEISHYWGFPMSWGYSKSSQIAIANAHQDNTRLMRLSWTQRASVELSLYCRFPHWNICSWGEMSCRATSSLRENSFHVPRWSCSAPAWRVTSRAWNQTSASHNRQTHHLIARHAKEFMPQGRGRGPVLVFRAAYSVTIAHASKLQKQGSWRESIQN